MGPSPRVMKPMTKEEWEKQQSVMRHVYDEESGRTRLGNNRSGNSGSRSWSSTRTAVGLWYVGGK